MLPLFNFFIKVFARIDNFKTEFLRLTRGQHVAAQYGLSKVDQISKNTKVLFLNLLNCQQNLQHRAYMPNVDNSHA